MTWGAEDLSASIGASATRDGDGRYTDVFRLARAVTILGAAVADVAAIDTVFVNFRDSEGLRRECLEAERDGFTAKMAIHPGAGACHQRGVHALARGRRAARKRSCGHSRTRAIPASSASTGRCTTARISGAPSDCWPGRRPAGIG